MANTKKEAKDMRRSRIGLASAGLMAVAGLTLAGCAAAEEEVATDAGDTTEEAAPAEETFDVYALLPQGNDQAYGTTYLPPMEAKAAELGINLTITNSEYDGDKQASECEVAVAAQPDGIILWPAIADTIRPCLEAADAAGIPVWVTNADVNPEDAPLTYGYSGTDSYGQGAASAEIMCEIVDGAEIGIIQINGVTGNSVATLRGDGFRETVASDCPNVTILAEQPGDWVPDKSQIAASEMLTSVGVENVQGMYAADDSMIKGGIDALKARGLDPADFFITSIGNTFLGNPLVISGELDGTVFQSSSWDGENAVVGIHRAMTGETQQGRDDEGSVLYMPNPKVTAANASDPEVAPEW
jgi:ribose transport system substrate-binding protein